MSDLLVAQNIVKSYGDYTAVKDVSIAVPKGSIYGLLGPNGAGKTSLIRIINQITLPDFGQLYFDGKPMQPDDVLQIGYLPEERGLYKSMKVGEQALYLAQLKGLSKEEARERLKYWFDRLDISGWWGKKIQELSKGMAQKIQFITTVMHQPKLLIFDEPFSGFDPVNANLIRDEILQLREEGATIIFSTHRMESVEELCDHIALINKSEKILDGDINVVRDSFKEGIFSVSLNYNEQNDFILDIEKSYQINKQEINQDIKKVQLEIKLGDHQDSNELLHQISKYGSISEFKEVIPSVDDIFIKSVNASTLI